MKLIPYILIALIAIALGIGALIHLFKAVLEFFSTLNKEEDTEE